MPKKNIKLFTWTDEKDLFINMAKDGEWFITVDNKLYDESYIENDDERHKVKDSFIIGDPAYTTGRLREYCDALLPDIDFDAEFKIDEPGVFSRFRDKFNNADDYIQNMIFADIVAKLEKRGYTLSFSN